MDGIPTVYKIVLGILVVVAIVLGGLVYKQYRPSDSGSQNQQKFSAENIFMTPGPDASEEEKRRHFEAVVKLAQDISVLEIGSCRPSPIAVRIKRGSSLTVKNPDGGPHVIGLDLTTTYEIKAAGDTVVTPEFAHGPGLYGFGCDNSTGTVGFFLVTD